MRKEAVLAGPLFFYVFEVCGLNCCNRLICRYKWDLAPVRGCSKCVVFDTPPFSFPVYEP